MYRLVRSVFFLLIGQRMSPGTKDVKDVDGDGVCIVSKWSKVTFGRSILGFAIHKFTYLEQYLIFTVFVDKSAMS